MQDDRKFLDSNSEEPDQEEQNEEKQKKIIELPDLDLPEKNFEPEQHRYHEDSIVDQPGKKELDPEYLAAAGKEKPQGEKRTPFDKTSFFIKPREKETQHSSMTDNPAFNVSSHLASRKNFLMGLPWGYLGLILVLSILLFVSTLTNISSVKNMSEIKTKAFSDAKLATQMVAEKEKVKSEQKTLEREVSRLKNEISSAQSISAGLQKQNENLKAEIAETNIKFDELQRKLKGYASEVKDLVSTRIGYYNAYSNEKENKQKLVVATKKMETEIRNLTVELDSIAKQFDSQESKYTYEMAFVFTKAQMYDDAIENFLKYLELTGTPDADIYYNLALIYEQVKKDNATAISYYRKYTELLPSAEDLYEVKMRISSLERNSTEGKYFYPAQKKFEINLEELKY
ncbi:MAG: hypothetical protein ABH844_03865 [Candidatus Omnitrophota bacterium]